MPDTTLDVDLDEQKQLYASFGIAEYWVINEHSRRKLAYAAVVNRPLKEESRSSTHPPHPQGKVRLSTDLQSSDVIASKCPEDLLLPLWRRIFYNREETPCIGSK
jgi:hypothetical protein